MKLKIVLPHSHTLASFARIYFVFVYFYSDFCQWQLPEQIFTRQQCNFKTALYYNLAPFAHTFSFCFILLFFVNQKIFLCFIFFTIIFLGQSATGNNPPPTARNPPLLQMLLNFCRHSADRKRYTNSLYYYYYSAPTPLVFSVSAEDRHPTHTVTHEWIDLPQHQQRRR